MRIAVISIFPQLFGEFVRTSLVGRAVGSGILGLSVHDLRDFTEDRHHCVDDEPYGGGGGMVMMAQPWIRAVRRVSKDLLEPRKVLLSPQGERLTDGKVRELARCESLLLLCGRYEAVDERVRQTVVDEEISIGDYVLSGGELPAMVMIEALSRQIPGVVGRADSVEQDSFRNGLLDYPHYTRPRVVEGLEVPEVLVAGDHGAVRAWRTRQSLLATALKRPDLLAEGLLDSQRSQLAGALGDDDLPAETRERLEQLVNAVPKAG